MTVEVDFRYIANHEELVNVLSPLFSLKAGNKVTINVNLNTYSILYADLLLLLVCVVRMLRQNGVTVQGYFIDFNENDKATIYASRIDFFKLLNFKYEEKFIRKDSRGKLKEITFFNNENGVNICNDIMSIFINDRLNDEMLSVLNFCIWEVLDNTLRHSESDGTLSNGFGYVTSQYFPNRKEIRLIIADNGQGIFKALTTHPKSEYKHLNEKEAVLKSIERGVTNSTGIGFGLWATATLISENGGELIIHSGNYMLTVMDKVEIKKAPFWKGTYTFLRINTDVPVSYDKIFENNSQYNHFIELKDKILGDIEDLW